MPYVLVGLSTITSVGLLLQVLLFLLLFVFLFLLALLAILLLFGFLFFFEFPGFLLLFRQFLQLDFLRLLVVNFFYCWTLRILRLLLLFFFRFFLLLLFLNQFLLLLILSVHCNMLLHVLVDLVNGGGFIREEIGFTSHE